MRIKTEEDLKQAIVHEIAMAVDGHANDTEDFLPEAESVYKLIRSKIGELLLRTPDSKIREKLNELFGLTVFVAIFDDDSEREVRPKSRQSFPVIRRTTRTRSSAGQTFRVN